jgi:hypothetical protein
MPEKNENTHRWGGPGSSQQDRTEPEPQKGDPRSPGEPTNTPFSHVSGGGGERDRHHGHDAKAKRDSEENSRERAKP